MNQAASLILLLIAAGLFIALVKGGWTGPGGVTSWFAAKFLGRTS